MPLTILRWKGGSGGDMLLQMISNQFKVINVCFDGISESGKTQTDFSWMDFANLTELQKISLRKPFIDCVDVKKLSAEIKNLDDDCETIWAKSHFYITDKFNSITVDIVADPWTLPFVVNANLAKTDILTLPINDLANKITDTDIRKKYTMYAVAMDVISTNQPLSVKQILVKDLLSGIESIQNVLYQHCGFTLTDTDSYSTWLQANHNLLPSDTYIEYVNRRNFDYHSPDLSVAEKYSLMALSGQKFAYIKQ